MTPPPSPLLSSPLLFSRRHLIHLRMEICAQQHIVRTLSDQLHLHQHCYQYFPSLLHVRYSILHLACVLSLLDQEYPHQSIQHHSHHHTSKQEAMQAQQEQRKPKSGQVLQLESGKKPANPVEISENLRLLDGDMYPSKTMWLLWTMVPIMAAIATRPCLRSTARRRSKASGSVSSHPRGSNTPSGSVTPSSSSFAMFIVVDARFTGAVENAAA